MQFIKYVINRSIFITLHHGTEWLVLFHIQVLMGDIHMI